MVKERLHHEAGNEPTPEEKNWGEKAKHVLEESGCNGEALIQEVDDLISRDIITVTATN